MKSDDKVVLGGVVVAVLMMSFVLYLDYVGRGDDRFCKSVGYQESLELKWVGDVLYVRCHSRIESVVDGELVVNETESKYLEYKKRAGVCLR